MTTEIAFIEITVAIGMICIASVQIIQLYQITKMQREIKELKRVSSK